MNLKLRLNLIITLLSILATIIGGREIIANAREDIRAEVQSTARLAKRMLDTQILYLTSYGYYTSWDASPFRLFELSNLRHLHIEFFNTSGRLVDSNLVEHPGKTATPPNWFSRMLGMGDSDNAQLRQTIIFNGKPVGELVITPDASYEIAEVWNDTAGLLLLAIVFFILINVMVYWAVNFALRPVDLVRKALSDLGAGKLDARLPSLGLPELQTVVTQFNDMAQNLQQSRTDNIKLTQQLINLQEKERKQIAQNLHDHLGQSLTIIQVMATTIDGAKKLAKAHEASKVILSEMQSVRSVLRSVLRSLRPGSLDELGLRHALMDLVGIWQDHNPNTEITLYLDRELGMMPETVSIAVYRLVQEALTNIARHAQAGHVSLHVRTHDGKLLIRIEDDGAGFDASSMMSGLGLLGMRERIEGLGGMFSIASTQGNGTLISAAVPSLIAMINGK
jgi:two-component system sensor histidine kinase UhpB